VQLLSVFCHLHHHQPQTGTGRCLIIDYREHIIPDQLVMSLVVFKLGYDLIINRSFITMLTNIGYSFLISVPLLLLTLWMEKKTGRFQMGGGDIKILGAIALFFSPLETLLILFIGSVIQLMSLKYFRATMLPLAPALFISSILVVFFI
jgi:prepilin signal peptidase PulO-like enzyme (type II secretory pathway)